MLQVVGKFVSCLLTDKQNQNNVLVGLEMVNQVILDLIPAEFYSPFFQSILTYEYYTANDPLFYCRTQRIFTWG